jgi:hypothetical protein
MLRKFLFCALILLCALSAASNIYADELPLLPDIFNPPPNPNPHPPAIATDFMFTSTLENIRELLNSGIHFSGNEFQRLREYEVVVSSYRQIAEYREPTIEQLLILQQINTYVENVHNYLRQQELNEMQSGFKHWSLAIAAMQTGLLIVIIFALAWGRK